MTLSYPTMDLRDGFPTTEAFGGLGSEAMMGETSVIQGWGGVQRPRRPQLAEQKGSRPRVRARARVIG